MRRTISNLSTDMDPTPSHDSDGLIDSPPNCGKLFSNMRRTISNLSTDTAHGATDGISESITSPEISSIGMFVPSEMDMDDFNPWVTHAPPTEVGNQHSTWPSNDAFGVYMHPNKVGVKEVDHSGTMCKALYSLKSRLHRTSDQVYELKLAKEQLFQDDLTRKESTIAEQAERMREELLNRDCTIANQTITLKRIESEFACVTQQTREQAQAQMDRIIERDTMIDQQAKVLEQLKQDLVSVTEQSSAAVQVQISKQMEKLAQFTGREGVGGIDTEMKAQGFVLKLLVQRLQAAQDANSRPSPSPSPIPLQCSTGTHMLPSSRLRLVAQYTQEDPSYPPASASSVAGDVHGTNGTMAGEPVELVAQRMYQLLMNAFPAVSAPTFTPTPQKRTKKGSRSEHVHDLFNDTFSVTKDEDYLLLHSPSKEDLATFSGACSNGPSPTDLHWDFNHPPSSDWNQAIIHILMQKLVIMREENEWTTAPRSDIYWKMPSLRSSIVSAAWAKDESLKKARRDARRVAVTNTAAMLRAERGEKDDALAWEFLNQVITTLGSDGMSSDESGQEDMEPVFFTRVMPWRRDIAKELKIIDTPRYLDSDILSPQGAKLAKHIRSTNSTSRKAVQELP
ncbi:hypothetical protein BU15DRAFT_63992 [Melanogaster broomeanus]|nr:hypothetical protein BU15DRAFT_63992 [Melanogaster broomeanus]